MAGASVALWFVVGLASLRRRFLGAGQFQEQREDLQLTAAPEVAAIDAFYRTYDNALLAETETNIRASLAPYQSAQDRERFLVRSYATFVTLGVFEYLWVLVYRSQLRAIQHVNGGPVKVDDLKPFHDKALEDGLSPSYAFSDWLAFMTSWLLLRQDGAVIQITVRGREFLKYMIESGKSLDDRRF